MRRSSDHLCNLFLVVTCSATNIWSVVVISRHAMRTETFVQGSLSTNDLWQLKSQIKDLGVTMNANMKVSEQCRIAAFKGLTAAVAEWLARRTR